VSAQATATDVKIRKLEDELGRANAELKMELLQSGVEAAGLVDPVPLIDLVGTRISMHRGDFIGAGASLISMIPGVGDAVGKSIRTAKLSKNMNLLRKVIAQLTDQINATKRSSEVASAAARAKLQAKEASEAVDEALVEKCPKQLEATETLANRVRTTHGYQNVIEDLDRGPLKSQGAKFLLERLTKEIASGKVAVVEDVLPDKGGVNQQAADTIRVNGDVVQFKSYKHWPEVQRDILGSGFSTKKLNDVPETRGPGEHEPGKGQAYKDAYRYAANKWRSGKEAIPLSGKFEYQIDGDMLLENGPLTKNQLKSAAIELESKLNSAYSQDFPRGKTRYVVDVVFKS
jgi:hypothetical protein